MIILHTNCQAQIEPIAARGNKIVKYYVSSGKQTVGFLQFNREINEWAINTECGFYMTSGFLSQVWTALIADLASQVSEMKGEDIG